MALGLVTIRHNSCLCVCVLEVNMPKIIWELSCSPQRQCYYSMMLKGCAPCPAEAGRGGWGGWYGQEHKVWDSTEGLQGAAGSQTRHRAVLPASSTLAGLLLVGSSWFNPTPHKKMGWEAETPCSIDIFTAGCHPSEQANNQRDTDP